MMKIKFDETFDWFDVLGRLADGETINNQQHNDLCSMAGDWPTCACGQLCKALPRLTDGKEPEDSILFNLGLAFSDCVNAENWDRSLEILNDIERRTAKLLGLKLVPKKKIKVITHEQKPYAVTMGKQQHERRLLTNRSM